MHSISNFPEDSFLQCIVIPTANPSSTWSNLKIQLIIVAIFRTFVCPCKCVFFWLLLILHDRICGSTLTPSTRLGTTRIQSITWSSFCRVETRRTSNWLSEESYVTWLSAGEFTNKGESLFLFVFFFVGFVCFTTAVTILFGNNHGHFGSITICERRINFYFALPLLRKSIIIWHLIHVQFSNLTVTNVEQELL